MSEDYLAQQQPTLTWNTARGVWEKAGMANLLCEHWELFSETWPTSGMMRNGQVFELPMQAHRTTVSEFSSLPTPTTSDRTGAAQSEINEGNPHDRLKVEVQLLRSPTASQGEGGKLGEEEARKRGNTVGIRDQAMDLAQLNGAKVSRAERNKSKTLMGTPQARENKGRPGRETEKNLNHDVARNDLVTNWGKFEPAIRRWEEVLGRPAPAPTKPDGKDGAHRLSSAFTEWMMGVPEGWITDVGLSRNDELKACGNGVVWQQAALALRILLEGVDL